jgi:hypothetical protein
MSKVEESPSEFVIDVFKFKINNYPNRDMKDNPPKFGDINIKMRQDDRQDEYGISVMNSTIYHRYNIDLLQSSNKYYSTYKETQPKIETRTTKTVKGAINTPHFLDNVEKLNHMITKNLVNSNISYLNDSHADPVIHTEINDTSKIISQMLDEDSNNSGYIQKLYFKNTDKVILFGDYHGSFHTFFRNMLRLQLMGVVDLTTYTINPGYKIIFLGDIIDRGQHSIEILSMIFNFMLNQKNSDSIVFIKGNHEDPEQSIKTTINFYMEFKQAFPVLKNSNQGISSIFNLFKKLPAALILINRDTNEKFWACHGYIHSQNTFDSVINRFINSEGTILIIPGNINQNMMFELKWNDPSSKTETEMNKRVEETTTLSMLVGIKRLKEFLDNTGVSFIIRGHNDNFANALLLSNKSYINETKSATHIPLGLERYQDSTNLSPLLDYNTVFSRERFSRRIGERRNNEMYTSEPLEKIFVNKKHWEFNENEKEEGQYYPVLTISTNTDVGRNLAADSFVILHNNSERINLVPNEETKNRTESYLKDKTIVYNKYLKYKNKYLQLKKN